MSKIIFPSLRPASPLSQVQSFQLSMLDDVLLGSPGFITGFHG